jgi:hypothetical protein
MAYIYPAPGVSGSQSTLKIHHTSSSADSTGLNVPALQDVTVNNANDVFTWTQLDTGSKKQIATTATNSLAMNIVLDQTSFFGDGVGSSTAASQGIFGLSKNKTKIEFNLYFGDTDTGTSGKRITGYGYITGLAPTASADAPVWVSPITITVDGDYTVAGE